MRLPDFPPLSIIKNRLVPGQWDVLAFLLVIAFFIYLAEAAHGLTQPLARLEAIPISLDPRALFGYSARTALRMLKLSIGTDCSMSSSGTSTISARRLFAASVA